MGRRHFQRRTNLRIVRQRILIVCEGETSEVNYFRAFRVTSAVVKPLGTGLNTLSLVRKTLKLKELNRDFEQIWCVFDKDDYPDKNFNDAVNLALKNGLRVAYSNRSFELWYLLHFEDTGANLTNREIKDKLSKYIGYRYDKSDKSMYQKLKELQSKAIKRANKLNNLDSSQNFARKIPNTTVYQLVTELNKYIN